MRRSLMVLTSLSLLAAACGGGSGQPSPAAAPSATEGGAAAAPSPSPAKAAGPRKADPRAGGFEVGFGEWAVTPEADAIRPGEVAFVVRNGGALTHGFEIEGEGSNSGSGGGEDRFKFETETFEPGETLKFTLRLAPGIYKMECFVANHDDLGMETLLEVRKDAPLVAAPREQANAVRVEGFAFAPQVLEVTPGTEVTWTNADPAEHTVTAEDGSWDSGPFGSGAGFSRRFEQPGEVRYFCAIHPTMKGTIRVTG